MQEYEREREREREREKERERNHASYLSTDSGTLRSC